MINFYFSSLLLCICLLGTPNLEAFTQPNPGLPPSKATHPPKSAVPGNPPRPSPVPKAVLPGPTNFSPPLTTSDSGQVYSLPGIATLQGGQWVGTEHLYNLSPNLGIVVEIVKPSTVTLPFTEDTLKDKIIFNLKSAGLSPRDSLFADQSPLPFLHMLIMVTPIDKGFVAYCSGSLLEQVELKRVYLQTGIIWQAITWEKQELITIPTEQIQEQLEKTILSIVSSFGERYRSYQK